jgi:hypothetical protein
MSLIIRLSHFVVFLWTDREGVFGGVRDVGGDIELEEDVGVETEFHELVDGVGPVEAPLVPPLPLDHRPAPHSSECPFEVLHRVRLDFRGVHASLINRFDKNKSPGIGFFDGFLQQRPHLLIHRVAERSGIKS